MASAKKSIHGIPDRSLAFTPTPDTYAARLLPVLFAPEIEDRSGAMFGAKGQAILPTTGLTPERVGAFIASSESLVGRALTA